MIADIARKVALSQQLNPHWKWSMTDENGLLLHHGHTQRRPTPTEAAFIIARDRVCATRGCRRPARTCDLDHRRERARQGPTHRGNMGPCCEPHHVMRTEHGYQVDLDPLTGIHTWTAPNGRTYTVGPGDELNLTADRDNPDHSVYRQPPLSDVITNVDGVIVSTDSAFDALMRKYPKKEQ